MTSSSLIGLNGEALTGARATSLGRAPKASEMKTAGVIQGQRQLKIHEQVGTFNATNRAKRNAELGATSHRMWAKNSYGQMEAAFIYGGEWFSVDVDLEHNPHTGDVEVLEVVLLCPKCGGPLQVRDKSIRLHFSDPFQAPDLLWRPKLSIEGVFACTYAEEERSGVEQARSEGVLRTACGFVGSIERGVCKRQYITGSSLWT